MKSLLAFAAVLLLLAHPATAAGEVTELAPAGTTASLDTGEIDTKGLALSVQLCGGTSGNVVSGTLTVYQGNKTGNLAALWTATLSSQSGCDAASFVQLPGPAALTRIVFTRTGGTYGAWLYQVKR